MAHKNLIEIKILGENATPDKISSKDIGELITNIEIMLAAIVARDNPTLGLAESEITIGLADIKHESYDLLFQSSLETQVINAVGQITASINSGDYAKIPGKSIEAVRTVRKLAHKFSTDIEFWQNNGQRTRLATVNATTPIDVTVRTRTGKTTIYGKVVGVVGEDPPRARIRLFSGDLLICNITRRDELQIARQLGQRLYDEVGVYGEARWDLRDMSIEFFQIERVTEYSKKSVNEALDSLNSLVGEQYREIDDFERLIGEIRGTSEEEI